MSSHRQSFIDQFPVYLVLAAVMIVGYYLLENSRLSREMDALRARIPEAYQAGAQEGKILSLQSQIDSLDLRVQTAETAIGLRSEERTETGE